jgi:hypothetical protein
LVRFSEDYLGLVFLAHRPNLTFCRARLVGVQFHVSYVHSVSHFRAPVHSRQRLLFISFPRSRSRARPRFSFSVAISCAEFWLPVCFVLHAGAHAESGLQLPPVLASETLFCLCFVFAFSFCRWIFSLSQLLPLGFSSQSCPLSVLGVCSLDDLLMSQLPCHSAQVPAAARFSAFLPRLALICVASWLCTSSA